MAGFSEDFIFQLARDKVELVKSQIATSQDNRYQVRGGEIPEKFFRSQFATLNEKKVRGKNIKYNPHAFTEQGIYMLATVLRGALAEQQSIFIMRAFRENKTLGSRQLRGD